MQVGAYICDGLLEFKELSAPEQRIEESQVSQAGIEPTLRFAVLLTD
jgi:hypothetical protein